MPPMTFDEVRLLARVERLPPAQRVAFAAACAQRILPGFVVYAVRHQINEPLVASSLDAVWDARCDAAETIDDCTRILEQMAESTEDWHAEESFAENAVNAVMHSAQSEDPQEAVLAAMVAYNAWDAHAMYALHGTALVIADVSVEAGLLAYPGVQLELARQSRDLAELESGVNISDLRDRARAESSELTTVLTPNSG